jgi:hypothetical protein
MTTYYRLEVEFDGYWWLADDTQFATQDEAEDRRDRLMVNQGHWAYYRIVKQGCPTRIVKVQIAEEVVREFPKLPVEDEA